MFGLEFIGYPFLLLVEWLVVFVVNVIPALAPPTWAVLSFFNITRPQNIWILVFIGVSASACGRFLLAKLSWYFTSRFASREKKKEFSDIEKKLAAKSWEKFVFTALYSLSPLPSNAIFIAFGATRTRLREVLAGFVVGRTISYLFLVFTTQKIFESMGSTIMGHASLWTILIELIGVAAVIIFFLFDWSKLIKLENQNESKPKGKKWAHKKK